MASVVAAWPMVALGTVLSQDTTYVSELEPRLYPKLSVPWWGKGVVLDPPADGSLVRMTRHQLAQPGQVIVSEIWAKHGSIGIVPPEGAGALVTSHFFLFDIEDTRLMREYMGYLITANYLTDQIAAIARGTTGYASIRPHHFLALTIPLPPLDEQRRIVARIEALAARIAEARGLRREAMAQSKHFWSTGAQQLLNSLPDADLVPLGMLVSVQGGGTPSKADPSFWEGPIPWVSPKDMKSRDIYDAADHISDLALSQSVAKLIEPGAVLVVTRGMILAHTVPVAILRVPAAINQDMKALVVGGAITPDYLTDVLRALNYDLAGLVGRSSHDTRKLETSKLLAFQIPLPPLDQQSRLVATFDEARAKVDSIIRLQGETAAELDALLPSVLDRAFRGEL